MASTTSMLKHWREAATLIMVSPASSKQFSKSKLSFVLTKGSVSDISDHRISSRAKSVLDRRSQDFDVLLLKRSSASKFMPDKYVYPGGVAIDNDFSSDWLSQFQKISKQFQQSLFKKLSLGSNVSAPMFQRQRDSRFSHIPPEVAFRLCAIRETFEESGILIASPVDKVKDITTALPADWNFSPTTGPADGPLLLKWRERVNTNPDEFLTMCKELNVIPAIWTLYEWSNWLTPKSAVENRRRFDTIFYICCLDHEPEAFEDNAETVNKLWDKPLSLIYSYYVNGSRTVAPPQIYELCRLLNFKSYTDLMEYCVKRQSSRVERWLPITMFSKDVILTLMPGDDLYPKDSSVTITTHSFQTEKTFQQLNEESPNRHCSYFRKDSMGNSPCMFIGCNIDIARGQVSAVSCFDPDLNLRSKM